MNMICTELPISVQLVEMDIKSIVQLLPQIGAEVNACDNNIKTTPLLEASRKWTWEHFQLLLQSGAKVNARDNNKTTPLLESCRNGHKNTVRLLLQKGAEVNSPDSLGTTPLLAARKNGDQNTVQLLLQNGAMWGGRNESSLGSLPKCFWKQCHLLVNNNAEMGSEQVPSIH